MKPDQKFCVEAGNLVLIEGGQTIDSRPNGPTAWLELIRADDERHMGPENEAWRACWDSRIAKARAA